MYISGAKDYDVAEVVLGGATKMGRPHIAVFGSRVRDVTVDVDLPDLYRGKPKLRELIRFHGNDPIIKHNTSVVTSPQSGWALRFPMKLNVPTKERKETCLSIDGETYYRLRGGMKYQLAEAARELPPGDEVPSVVELPCRGRNWGGGGVNLACAIRGMSKATTTPITYLDIGRKLAEKKWYRDLVKKFGQMGGVSPQNLAADIKAIAEIGEVAGRLAQTAWQADHAGFNADVLRGLRQVQGNLNEWLQQAGERAYRVVAGVASMFDALESADFFLTRQDIRFAMLREAGQAPPFNLVFAEVRDTARAITDKIIFRGHREGLGSDAQTRAVEMLREQVPNPGLIGINTLYDTPLFMAALEWATEVQAKQRANSAKHRMCPVLLVLTPKNVKHFKGRRTFERTYAKLENLYVLFNESEFGDYISRNDRQQAEQFVKSMRAGFLPEGACLRSLFNQFDNIIAQPDKRFIVTFGSLGSIGMSHQHIVYVGTYAVPEKHIFGTNGCGDAYGAGVALAVYHKHNQKPSGAGHLSPPSDGGGDIEDLTLMMQLGTAAAYSKATSPSGAVTQREVTSLLENEYLPTADRVSIGDVPDGPLARPLVAKRVRLEGQKLLREVLDG